MDADLIDRIAQETAELPNAEAWQHIETLLALAGAPRKQWMKLRTEIWAQRKEMRRVAAKQPA